ncbi:MAG TPA: ABC transporter substrate-binding protein [Chloroflexota bacterium]|jgi:NitT/TauT family transport system substrate-binding protein|nr:ABC transporter substrate-binding protein [Chloroflexota bacterium]
MRPCFIGSPVRLGLGLLLLVPLLACQAPAPAASKPQPAGATASSAPTAAPAVPTPSTVEVVRMADTRVLAGGPIYLAVEKGYLREQGIELQFETMAGAADVVPFLATGDLDLAVGAIAVGLFNAFDRGLDIRIIAPAGIMTLEDSPLPLVVRKDLYDSGEIRTPSDLRGHRVGVNTRGGSVEYVLDKILTSVGLTIQDVDQVPIAFPDMPAALANGSLDAAIPAEPFATRAVDLGVGHKLVTAVIPGQMTTCIIASGKFLRERPDTAKRFVLAYMHAIRDIQPPQLGTFDPERFYTPEHLAIFEKYTGAPAQVLRNQVPYTWDVDLVIQKDSLMDQQLTHMRNGLLQIAQPVPYERMVDETFVRYAQQVMGRLRS